MRSKDAIEKDLVAQREKLQRLGEVAHAVEERVGRAETERSANLVDALTGDGEAQKKLDRAGAHLDGAWRARQDAELAIAQVEGLIKKLNAELAAAEKDGLRLRARKLVENRAADGREQRIRKMVIELEGELEALKSSNAEIVEAIRWFDAGACRRAHELLSGQAEPVRIDRGNRGKEPLDRFAACAPQIHNHLLSLLGPANPGEGAAPGLGAVVESTAG